jgi:enamine deaminase RidA (YjgF/YER057c/UK114 family)
MTPEDRLQALGLELPDPPVPVGAYTLFARTGNLLFLSGTTCYDAGRPLFRGKLGRELTVEQGYAAARQTALNLLAILRRSLGDLGQVSRVVKLNGYVNSAPGFTEQPAVINGASDLLQAILGDRGRHARTSVGVAELPGDIPVEIEMIVEVASPRRAARASAKDGRSRAVAAKAGPRGRKRP